MASPTPGINPADGVQYLLNVVLIASVAMNTWFLRRELVEIREELKSQANKDAVMSERVSVVETRLNLCGTCNKIK